MYELIYYLKEIGNFSLDAIWFPLAIWTLCCGIAFIVLRNRESLNPLFHYHLRTAALLSLPFGIGAAALMNRIPAWFAESNIETAFFVVQNPIELVPSGGNSSAEISINWMEPSLLIGLTTVILGLVSLFMLGRLISSYLALKSLYRNLDITELQDVLTNEPDNNRAIKLAFHDHPLVPFTFGWKQPVIVLPKLLQHEPEKLEMALQHELTHIKRGDYLLQLALSMIESLFWFHPLIRYGNQEIDTYREISCDQEVLSRSGFSIKSYASLLYELVPLSSGAGRLSVSMAVKNSTLKKRIKTMKYHKLHKASFRQSIAFLLLMIVGITLPIACSDLRGPEVVSNEELENTQISIRDAALSINGISLDNKNLKNVSTGGLGSIIIMTGEYGAFNIAPRPFDGAIKTGEIEGNNLSFKINELNVELRSSSEILSGISNSSLWVKHVAPLERASKEFGPMLFANENAGAPMPPRPPAIPTKGFDDDLGDYFVVVEEMPKLIDGMASIQSKIEYPAMARQAGIEGRVTVQFIVNEQGDVENPQVVRGIGGGADEEALRVVKQAKFEPGIQRGRAVRVQYALSINFRLEDSNYSSIETE
ncbi:M56 family metallopeptidase [Gracilimonas amylolytica]|uniref:M56 family metallopeptidase n=1 Tax=Gracilimonas amylolytica TaxID=1749045 RepID=UPI000CD9526C|nr:M56 family metallopeptidase [Gracilimonas amylolytica]